MLLTATMITGHIPERRCLSKMSAKCFDQQDFPRGDRELLILNTGKPLNIQSQYVREITLNQGQMKLGDLRNLAIDEARGEYVIQWDDDDWHHPRRCLEQFDNFDGGPESCCMLKRQIRCNFLDGSCFAICWDFGIPGTILHRKDCPFRYPSWKRSEDSHFHELFGKNVAKVDLPNLYCRFYHGYNTWHEEHVMNRGWNELNPPDLVKFLEDKVYPSFSRYLVALL